MPGGWWPAAIGAVCGGALTLLLVSRGLGQLARTDAATTLMRAASGVVGGLAGAALLTSERTGTPELVPAMIVWGCALVAAAACDAVTQRIPTPLVRQALVATAVLLTVGCGMSGDWRGLVLSGVGALAAVFTMLLCWRYAGAGFGDVRLAALGGLGLGHATLAGFLLGLAVLATAVTAQVAIAMARGGTRHTLVPLAPALAAGFVAAVGFR